MKTVKLPSGAELKMTLAPYADGKDLYQILASEIKGVRIEGSLSIESDLPQNLIKDAVCTLLSSKKFEAAIMKCLGRCLYDGAKFNEETFEPEEARQDFIPVCIEVAKFNVAPFMKGLSAGYADILQLIIANTQT